MLFYWIALTLSLCTLVLFFGMAIRAGRTYISTRLLSPSRLLAIGVFLSIWLLFLPYSYLELLQSTPLLPRIWQSIWVGVYQVIRFFGVAADYTDLQQMAAVSGIEAYTVLGTLLLILAPLLTFSVILSFFRNFSAYRRYLMHPKAPTYVFSELNEKSLHLAADLRRNHGNAVVIFADVFEEESEESFEIVERAKEIGAICFKKDMLTLNLAFHSQHSLLCFFAMAEENSVRGAYRQISSASTAEEENLRQAHRLTKHPYYAKRPNTKLFVFSSTAQGEILINNLPKSAITVRRVERFRPLIMRTLFESGYEFLFQNSLPQPDGTKAIRVLVIGAGGYGTEMIKALCWCTQIEGYSLSIDVLDYDPATGDRFAFAYPGLMQNSGNKDPGMAQYSLRFHNGVSVDTGSFIQKLTEIERPTYVLVALGTDERNVSTALAVRRFYRQTASTDDKDPFIHAIVYESENKSGLENATNERGQHYNIHYIGDLVSSYSERVIINEEMAADALRRHQKWGSADFENDYLARAAMSVTLYHRFLSLCGIKSSEHEEPESLSPQQRENAELYEHKRWCAFMFSEGYVYAPHTHGRRDDIAKTHCELIPFDRLYRERYAPKESR